MRPPCERDSRADTIAAWTTSSRAHPVAPPPRTRPASIDRRRLLKLAAACATTLWLPRSAWSQPRFASDPFALGVASGSPTHDSVVLWTRLHPEGILRIEPRVRSHHRAVGDRARRQVQPDRPEGSVHRRAPRSRIRSTSKSPGLEPDRWYFYRFMVGDAQSAVGRTRTFPAPDAAASRLRIAYASCQRWEHGYFSAYRHMREDEPRRRAVPRRLHLRVSRTRRTRCACRPAAGCARSTTIAQRYALHKSDPDLQAMHAACPWLVTWDDHEVQNDYAGLKEGQSGAPVADFAALRAAAYQAYYEHMPLRAAVLTRALAGLANGAEMRIHSTRAASARSRRSILLDDRQYRDPQACTRDGKAGSSTVDPAQCAEWDGSRAHAARRGAGALARRRVRARKQGLERRSACKRCSAQRDFRSGPGPARSGTTAGTATPPPAPA